MFLDFLSFRDFWRIILVITGVHAFRGKVHTLWVVELIALVFDLTGVVHLDRQTYYEVVICGSSFVVWFKFLFLDRKEYNIPVYLAVTKSSTPSACTSHFQRVLKLFGGAKHWATIIPANENGDYFYIFDVKGTVLVELKPEVARYSKEKLVSKYCGFYEQGLTSKRLVRRFLEKSLKGSYSCQQYTFLVINSLVYPHYSSVPYYCGRFEFCIVLFVFLIQLLINIVLGFNFDLDLILCLFLHFDFFTEFVDDNSHEAKIKLWDGLLASVLFIFCSLTGIFRVNGFLMYSMLVTDFVVYFFWLKIYSKRFKHYHHTGQN